MADDLEPPRCRAASLRNDGECWWSGCEDPHHSRAGCKLADAWDAWARRNGLLEDDDA